MAKGTHVSTVYLYRHRDYKRGDVHYWAENALPEWMLDEWHFTCVYSYYTEDTTLGGSTRIIVVNPDVQAVRDELARATRAFMQNPTPPLGSIIKKLGRKLRHVASL
jgi:hypothetical protein